VNNDGFVRRSLHRKHAAVVRRSRRICAANSPYGTDCNTPMQVGNPGTPTNPAIFCQFVFDITTFYDPNKKVERRHWREDQSIQRCGGSNPAGQRGVCNGDRRAGCGHRHSRQPIGFTITIANNSAGTASNATLSDPLPSGTNVSWAINPAYVGPGTCAITGAVGNQVLNCSFGNVAPNASFSVHVLSASSSAGGYLNASTVTAQTSRSVHR